VYPNSRTSMGVRSLIGLVCLCLGGNAAEPTTGKGGMPPPVDSTPYPVRTSHLTLPPFLEERVIYHHSFGTPEPDINPAKATQARPPTIVPAGFAGAGCFMDDPQGVQVDCPAFSPHRALTLSFWWAVKEPLQPNGGMNIFALRNRGRGYISNFVRGGPWCALQDSAFCFQLYNLQGIKNVHSNFDRQFRQRYTQSPTAWHHTVLTASLGSRLALFVDGQRVGLYQLSGRALREADALCRLGFGCHNQKGLFIDEVTVLDVALSDEQVVQWHTMIRSLEKTGHLRQRVAEK